MARDLGRYQIRAVAIAPGIFRTPLGDGVPQYIKDKLRKDTPMDRAGEPSELAHFAATIVENTYINGVALRIDGATRVSHI